MKLNFIDFIKKNLELELLNKELSKTDSIFISVPENSISFLLEYFSKNYLCFYVSRSEPQAEDIFESLKSMGINACFFPDIDAIPFSSVIPSIDKLSTRITTLYNITNNNTGIVITTYESFIRKLPPVEYLKKSIIEIKLGDKINLLELSDVLINLSYRREYKVTEPGTFSIRGDIFDIFPPDSKDPFRISVFGNVVDDIRIFDPVSQKSINKTDKFLLIPASEFSIKKEIYHDDMKVLLHETKIHYNYLKFYNEYSILLDYACNKNVLLIYSSDIEEEKDNIYKRYLINHELEDKHKLLENFDIIINKYKNKKIINSKLINDNIIYKIENPPEFGEGFSQFIKSLEENYLKDDYKIFILVEYKELALRLLNIIKNFNPILIENDKEYDFNQNQVFIIILNFEHGLLYKNKKILVLTEGDISNKKKLFRKRIRQIDAFFEDFEEIKENEYVVHINYGIGIFRKIQRINILGKEKDYILIEYANNEKLYVPLEQSNLIGKYIGDSNIKPQLDSIGGRSWAKKREKVKKSIEEYAKRLVSIYAKRTMLKGHAFSQDTTWQKEFEDQFEYIETPDQVKVLEEIKKDMEADRPMDRLLCGDVGFGKTEIAMRAAFKAISDGKQVAVIAPTTVLVEQHYYTFLERFKNFPVKIEYLSRFTENKEFKDIIKRLEKGDIDIIIGTHKLFSNKIRFYNLGLVVIDEEHKFGVFHKENLKEKYPLVDYLTLSATPIPRTLNMALSSIRDISLLQTPPDMRIPVKTYVSEFNLDIVKYAIEYELNRNGQVFFVHNTIKRLPEYAYLIEKYIPSAKVTIGHGRMEEHELERAYLGFVKGEYNVFVCTTIIDSGLDIPNANTIIISDAHMFGLSQLYQLKGRVGRSKRQGFAYFLYPANVKITENAEKRLYVINEYTDLGSGFNIALKDLEIRGAGNILGKEQHGNIVAVGYDLYIRLLREEIEKLKGNIKEEIETVIDLNYNAYIPDNYISDNMTKMEVYKKILSVRQEQDIKFLSEELMDRFGKIPPEILALFEISRLKIISSILGVESILEKDEYIEITFSKYSKVDPAKVIALKSRNKYDFIIKPYEKNKIFYKSYEIDINQKVKKLINFFNEIKE